MTIRQAQSQRTTVQRIATAGTKLFLEQGYRVTTMADLAAAADVAIQTIYNTVGSKSAVLNLVLDDTVSGPEAPRPVPEFMRERTESLPSAEAVIKVLADWLTEVHGRSGAVFRMIREAAAVDPEVAALETEREQRRLSNYLLPARLIQEKAHNPPRLDEQQTAATIWSVGHPHVYQRLVTDGNWTPDGYREWVFETLKGALLDDRPRTGGD